jgi:hypothetical protein
MLGLARSAGDRLRGDHTGSTGLSSWAYGGSWPTVSQPRAAIRAAIAALTWVFELSQTITSGPPSWWAASRRRV